jgi:hypothetical protein
MKKVEQLNPLAKQTWVALLAEYPDWEKYFGTCGENDLEVAVPAPAGSNAGHLVVFTARGEDLWLRYSPGNMCYMVDDQGEMLDIVKQLLAEKALFVVTMQGDKWAGTTLIRPGQEPELEDNQVALVVSWSGAHDRTVHRKSNSASSKEKNSTSSSSSRNGGTE